MSGSSIRSDAINRWGWGVLPYDPILSASIRSGTRSVLRTDMCLCWRQDDQRQGKASLSTMQASTGGYSGTSLVPTPRGVRSWRGVAGHARLPASPVGRFTERASKTTSLGPEAEEAGQLGVLGYHVALVALRDGQEDAFRLGDNGLELVGQTYLACRLHHALA